MRKWRNSTILLSVRSLPSFLWKTGTLYRCQGLKHFQGCKVQSRVLSLAACLAVDVLQGASGETTTGILKLKIVAIGGCFCRVLFGVV